MLSIVRKFCLPRMAIRTGVSDRTVAFRGALLINAISPKYWPFESVATTFWAPSSCRDHFHFSALNEVGAVAFLSLLKNHLSRPEVLDFKQTTAPQEPIRCDAKYSDCRQQRQDRCNG